MSVGMIEEMGWREYLDYLEFSQEDLDNLPSQLVWRCMRRVEHHLGKMLDAYDRWKQPMDKYLINLIAELGFWQDQWERYEDESADNFTGSGGAMTLARWETLP